MEKKSKVLLALLLSLLIISSVAVYYRTMILKNFEVEGSS